MVDYSWITLPDRDEMLRRLLTITQTQHTVEGFFPHILSCAGQRLRSKGVVNMVWVAFLEYTDRANAAYTAHFMWLLESSVRALIDDEVVLAEALQLLEESLADLARQIQGKLRN